MTMTWAMHLIPIIYFPSFENYDVEYSNIVFYQIFLYLEKREFLVIMGRILAAPRCVSVFISYQTIRSLTVIIGQAVTDRVSLLFNGELENNHMLLEDNFKIVPVLN
jgi:hypothetical protein